MKVVLIVLALIAAAFVAVVVYGVGRDEPAATTSSDGRHHGPPPMRNGEPDEDALEDWDPPDFGSFATGLGNKFAPGVEVADPEVSVGGFAVQSRQVAPSDEKFRIARLQLVAGRSARITASQPGERNATLCLCKPGVSIVGSEVLGCGDRWIEKQSARNCEAGADEGSLAFKSLGGTLSFASGQPARVRVKRRDN
jgi:hypothetical protein